MLQKHKMANQLQMKTIKSKTFVAAKTKIKQTDHETNNNNGKLKSRGPQLPWEQHGSLWRSRTEQNTQLNITQKMKVIGTSRNSNKQIKELCGEGLERHRSREAHSHSNQSHKTTSGQQMIPRAAADMGKNMGRCGEAESNKTLN